MPPSARSSPPVPEEILAEEPYIDEIPSLDDIIPWVPPERPPRQLEVFDAVRSTKGINVTFLQNVVRSFYSRDGDVPEVEVLTQDEAPMDTPNLSQRNTLVEVNIKARVDDREEIYHMVIKTLTTSQPVRTLSAMYLFDRREIGMYTQILEDINVFQRQQVVNAREYTVVPSSKCFLARYTALGEESDSEEDYSIPDNESVVVLENVKYKGFDHTMIKEGLTKEQTLIVLEGIARLHGLSLAMKERSGIPLQRSYPYLLCLREVAQCLVTLFDKKIAYIKDMLVEFGAGNISEKVMDFRPNLAEFLELLARPEEPISVLSHMNLWAHNILFKGDECVFVDWQMITCARPTFDVAFLLATSVPSGVRRMHTNEFLDHYYYHFTTYALRYGLDIEGDLEYTRQDLRQEYRYSQVLAMFFCIGKSSDVLDERETKSRFVDFYTDLDTQDLLDPDNIDLDAEEYDYWMPRNPSRSNVIFRVERENSSDDEVDHICGLFPVYELPED